MILDGQMNRNRTTIEFEDEPINGARIKVIGVGGGGSNAVNRMIDAGVKGVEFIVANTDVQALSNSKAPVKLQLGNQRTRGLGAGADPNVGREAAMDDTEKIIEVIEGADMVFVTAGLGGGTGTGAAPVIAALAMELDCLTVAVVTKPFTVEGKARMNKAENGLSELRGCVDTIITIPNSKLKEVEEKITITEAFRRADNVLLQAVEGISNLITIPGMINLDFADVRAVMKNMGVALMGVGSARGNNATVQAMKMALDSKLLEENSIRGAKGALINITGNEDMPLDEIEEAIAMVHEEADENANIIFGTVIDSEMQDEVKVTVIATGFENQAQLGLPEETNNETNAVSSQYNFQPGYSPIRAEKENLDVPTFIRRKAD
jgi:cell division protein FtsZ